jgi:hypothetical protein
MKFSGLRDTTTEIPRQDRALNALAAERDRLQAERDRLHAARVPCLAEAERLTAECQQRLDAVGGAKATVEQRIALDEFEQTARESRRALARQDGEIARIEGEIETLTESILAGQVAADAEALKKAIRAIDATRAALASQVEEACHISRRLDDRIGAAPSSKAARILGMSLDALRVAEDLADVAHPEHGGMWAAWRERAIRSGLMDGPLRATTDSPTTAGVQQAGFQTRRIAASALARRAE